MFWKHRSQNITLTWVLLVAFILLLVAVGLALDLAMGAGAGLFLTFFALLIAVPAALYTYWKSDELVLRMTGAVPADPKDDAHLYHATEGLAIAAGIPMPRLYILETDVPNAFATGRNPERGVVAVTRGLLNMMNREEVEGVIAHELAHIRNYDILLVTVAAVMAAAIMVIAHVSLRAMAFGGGRGGGGRGGGGGGGGALVMVLAFLALLLAPLVARLVKLAISRRREYLADAEAARITRNPRGLRNALAKLAESRQELLINDALASLFIVHPLRDRQDPAIHRRIHQLFMTHPPVEERMRRLDSM